MTVAIKRFSGYDAYFPEFKSFDAAIKYIEDNTGAFTANEIIALIDYEIQKVIFIKVELTVIARVLQ